MIEIVDGHFANTNFSMNVEDLVAAADCKECETKEGKVDHIERAITLEGKLSEEQKAQLLEIANRCPVHRTLESEIHVVTRYV